MKIKKGDKVKIILGKDQGKTATVERVSVKKGKLLLAGMNLVKRHVKGQRGVEGGIIDLPKPIDISNVLLVCPNCSKPTRVGLGVTKEGVKKRVCQKCDKQI